MTDFADQKTSQPDNPVAVHWVRFTASLLGAPALLAAIGGVLLALPPLNFVGLILLMATVMGGPVWLLLGTPALIWLIRRGTTWTFSYAACAFVGNLLSPILAIGGASLIGGNGTSDAWHLAQLYLGFGCVFAPLWTVLFVALYRPAKQAARREQPGSGGDAQ